MSTGWEDHEPAPLEFFHGRLHDLFHEYRMRKSQHSFEVPIDGLTFNDLIAKAKMETYSKYEKLELHKPIEKSRL